MYSRDGTTASFPWGTSCSIQGIPTVILKSKSHLYGNSPQWWFLGGTLIQSTRYTQYLLPLRLFNLHYFVWCLTVQRWSGDIPIGIFPRKTNAMCIKIQKNVATCLWPTQKKTQTQIIGLFCSSKINATLLRNPCLWCTAFQSPIPAPRLWTAKVSQWRGRSSWWRNHQCLSHGGVQT